MKRLLTLLFLFTALTVSAQNKLKELQDNSGKWGFVNSTGSWVVAPQFDDVYQCFFSGTNSKIAVVKYKGKWGCIDNKGKWVVKPVFEDKGIAHRVGICWENEDPLGRDLYELYDNQTGKYGFVNHIGNWAILPQYEECYFDFMGLYYFAVVKYQGKWGGINKKGEWRVKPVFSKGGEAYGAVQDFSRQESISVPPARVADHSNIPTNGVQWSSSSAGQIQTTNTSISTSSTTPTQSQPTASQNVNPPTLVIISPTTGGGYDREDVVIKYNAKAFDGSVPVITITIDGNPYDVNIKGVRRANDELQIKLPVSDGKRIIQLTAKDARGFNSEPVSLALQYTGAKLKPVLHTLVIGVGKYNDATITPLEFAAKDAEDMSKTFRNVPATLYRKIEEPILLTNEKATASNIKRAITQIKNKANQDDVVMLYFSGHGVQEDGQSYFLSSDAELKDLFATAFNFNDIHVVISQLTTKQCKVITFMDACHAGALNTKAAFQPIQFAEPGAITFTSSTSGQKSIESKTRKNGVFTAALIDGLNGKARDKNGDITTLELGKYIKEIVQQETNGTQTPIIENKIGEFVLFK
jgi:hypothetical protein